MSNSARKHFLQLDGQSIDRNTYAAGLIWCSALPQEDVQFDASVLLMLCDFSEGRASMEISGSGVTALLERRKVGEIDPETYELLIAVKEPGKRIEVYRDPSWLQEGLAIKINSKVIISGGENQPMTGVVRFCGVITIGRLFGVELDPPFHGKGSSNGMFKRIKYFACEEDCALFVNIYRVRLYKEQGLRTEQVRSSEEMGFDENGTSLKLSMQYDDYPLRIGERIVWMSDDGPEFGIVKWIGHLPDTRTSEATVGIEFDNPIGSGTGRYKSQRLFTARRNHASLVPLMGLMKLSDYLPDVTESTHDAGLRGQAPRSASRNELGRSLQVTHTDMAQPWLRTNVSLDGAGEDRNVDAVMHEMQKLDLKIRQAPIRGRVMPPSVAADAVDSLCGREKGLQGRSNSCGLESVIFALFAFSSCFDDELYMEPRSASLRATIKKMLVEEIVNPLRATNYVSADRISRYSELISLIEKPDVCTDGPESSTPEAYEDITNVLRFILSDLLGISSLISSSNGRDDYVFRIPAFDRTLLTETVQHAIDRVHLALRFWIAEVPSHVFIVDIGQRHHASTMGVILPSPIIDISDLLEGSPRHCKICGALADLECSDCFATETRATQRDSIRLGDVSFCGECFGKLHQRTDRKLHLAQRLQSSLCANVSTGVKMELFAMVSLVNGHYVSFVVSGSAANSPWLFYDGMAKRVVSDRQAVFVPEVRRCLEVNKCLEDFGVGSYGSVSAMPELVQHMISGLRLCFYRRMKVGLS